MRRWFRPRMTWQTPVYESDDLPLVWLGNRNGWRTWYGRRFTTWTPADVCRRSWPSATAGAQEGEQT